MSEQMTPERFNALHPVGTPVVVYPGCRPEDDRNAERIETVTRTEAWSAHGKAVVMVKDHGAWIALSHVDPTPPGS